ncbi:hypothetical protein [Enterococcus devriesei]|uniref:hypothetical protein n=1 Tax=Enterococcus devriesei TaxID=319970 RepID=UPI0036D3471B
MNKQELIRALKEHIDLVTMPLTGNSYERGKMVGFETALSLVEKLDGYEVEEEPKWVVLGERGYLTSLSIGKGKSTGWTGNNDKHGSGAIHFEDEETALHTAYITGGTVEKV